MSYYPNQQPGYNQQGKSEIPLPIVVSKRKLYSEVEERCASVRRRRWRSNRLTAPYQQNYGQQQSFPPQQFGQHPSYPPPPQEYNSNQAAFYQNYQPPPGPQQQEHQRFIQPVHPPPGQYQQPPPPGFAPPPQSGHYAPPPQGAYPPQQYVSFNSQPMPSLGYVPGQQAQGNLTDEAIALRKAMKGWGTKEKVLIGILTKLDPLQMQLLVTTYNQHHKRDLGADIYSETSGDFRGIMMALISGPLHQDVMNVREALRGIGTKRALLDSTLLGRSNADMRAIKQAYQTEFSRSLEADVASDLTFKTKDLFNMVTAANRAEENAPVVPQNIQHDVAELNRAMKGMGTTQETVCSIIAHRSDGQLRAIAGQYQQTHGKSLHDAIESDFNGHMKEALLLMLGRACDKAMTDAVSLEDSMKGLGTNETLLLNHVVRIHWDRAHMDQVKRAYNAKYNKELSKRVRDETSGDFRKTLLACLE